MKILIVGSNKVWAIENIYKKELAKKASVELFNAHGAFQDYYHASFYRKLKYRLGTSKILKKINQNLIQKAQDFQPDVVWVFKGMELFPKTLEQLKRKGVVLVNYNPDHPFRFASRGSGNKNVLKSIQLYDHHFTYSIQIQRELEEQFGVSTSWLPFGYLKAQRNNSKQLIKRICFIGNPDDERARVIKLLIDSEVPLTIYGNHWEQFIDSSTQLVEIHQAIYEDEFAQKAQQYAVQLNLLRKQNEGSHNMRTFEMPALGCLMLAPRSKEHLALFEERIEAVFYGNDQELVEQAKQLLKLNSQKINDFQVMAYQRSVNSDYSYSNRAKKVYQLFEQLIKKSKR